MMQIFTRKVIFLDMTLVELGSIHHFKANFQEMDEFENSIRIKGYLVYRNQN